jgi:hypothetical protein
MDSRERKLLCGKHQKEHTLRISKDRTSPPFESRPLAPRRDFHEWVGSSSAETLNFIRVGVFDGFGEQFILSWR